MDIAEVTGTGMTGIISQLTTGLSPDKFFATLGEVMPFVIMMVPIALGVYFLRRLVKGSSRAKVKF